MPFLHHISANSHTCGCDAITFVGSMSSLEVTLTMCHNLGLLSFSLPKILGGGTKFRSHLYQFCPFLSFDKFLVFSVSNAISCCLMYFLADLMGRQQTFKLACLKQKLTRLENVSKWQTNRPKWVRKTQNKV